MTRVLIETQYLPSLEFFCAIAKAEEIKIEAHEYFVKQSYRNHTIINAANGTEKLTVPLTAKGNRIAMKDVKIDHSQNWKTNQWRTLESAYRKSPFYEHYADDLNKILYSPNTYLLDLNIQLLSLCLNWLHWKKELTVTQSYQGSANDFLDLRNVLLSKKSYSTRDFYRPFGYVQVFGSTFVENLSLIDLVFCKGPESGNILHASALNL